MDGPLTFAPFLRPMVWGGRRLAAALGKPLPETGTFGESWEVSDHASHHSQLTQPADGRTLRHLMTEHRDALLGAAAGRHQSFPWLIKFLDAHDWLSVQVHPDDEAATRLWPGECGKTEAWFILDAAPEARVYAGLKPGVDAAALRKALTAGRAADCLHQFTPTPGDCLFLKAGTVHAVGGGVLMAEVQQTSDATFRLYDWDRRDAAGQSRTLHIEQSLACIDWSAGPVAPVHALGFPEHLGAAPAPGAVRQSLVRCPFFELDYMRDSEPMTLGGSGRLQAVIVLHGRGNVESSAADRPVRVGDVLLLPAQGAATVWKPEEPLGLLTATLPL